MLETTKEGLLTPISTDKVPQGEVEPMPKAVAMEELAVPLTVRRLAERVEEAFNTPLTSRLEENVEEAVEMNPLNIELPPTVNVEEADNGPANWRELEIVEEAVEMNPAKVERPLTPKVLAIVADDEA